MSLHVGEAVGDYRVIGIIGAGGMGQVFQVEHKITKRKEAMKVLIADLADDTQIQRFRREIEVQARLNHPNIAAVHNAFRLKDRLVLVLEFVEGQTLESLLKQGRPPLETGIDFVRQTLEALDYAHRVGVIHRDVSPANLMVTENGLVKLMDFGVAKSLGDLRLTDGGCMIGSLYYMSPEQVKGVTEPNPRSDIYSTGAILYEVVTGKRPFDYEDRFSLMVAQVEEQPRAPSQVNPELPVELDEIILKALAKDPAERYSSAKEFLAALEIIQQPVRAFAPGALAGPKRRAVYDVAASVAVVGICALAGAGTITWNRLNEPFPPPTVRVAVPRAPENLAALPAALPIQEKAPVVAVPQAAESTAVAHATTNRKEVSENTPVETKQVEAPAPEVLSQSREEADPQVPGQQAPQAPSSEQKKGRFWGKLNPFHGKVNIFKKKKEDAAFRAPDESTPSRQE